MGRGGCYSTIEDINGSLVINKTLLKEDGDFRSSECLELLKQSDIIVTNPPFSLFREHIRHVVENQKKFLILATQNCATYKYIFDRILKNEIWLGYKNGNMEFRVPPDSEPRKTRYWVDDDGQKWRSMGNIVWLTNMDIDRCSEYLKLEHAYNEYDYPKYENLDAIEVNKVANIPNDYDGIMGVPITFLNHYCPEQFEIVGLRSDLIIGEKTVYKRILIRHRSD